MSEKNAVKKTNVKVADIICYVCAAMFCAIPFVPFVDEMGIDFYINDLGDWDSKTVVVNHLVLTYVWYAYFTIVIAGLIVASVIIKKNTLRLITLVAVFAETIVLVIRANQLVMKIFTGDLYEPSVGYYILIAAAAIYIIVTLVTMMKEKNASTAKQKEDLKDKADDKLEARDEGDK